MTNINDLQEAIEKQDSKFTKDIFLAKDNSGEIYCLNIDSTSEYADWSKIEYVGIKKATKATDDIRNKVVIDFRRKSGEYYDNKIVPGTLMVITVGVSNIQEIDITEETKIEKLDKVYSKLSEEEIKYIKNK